jgi:hypothetical protein
MISVEELLADPPKLHLRSSRSGAGDGPGLTNQWKLSDEELLFISRHIAKSSRTLETGAGCSTILFAMLGSRHTCIVPDQPLVDRIFAFCNEKQIPTANLSFIVGISERVLPQLKDQDFDLVLIIFPNLSWTGIMLRSSSKSAVTLSSTICTSGCARC